MLLIDDERYLKGREPTRGIPSIVQKYLYDDTGKSVKDHTICGIKHGSVYSSITKELPQKNLKISPASVHIRQNSIKKLLH